MKTVRTGVFETNSSSTHSITIKHIKLDDLKLVDDRNILYPGELSKFIIYSDNSEILIADTKDKKAALICNYLKNDEDLTQEQIIKYFNTLTNELGYTDIISDFTSDFSYYAEGNTCFKNVDIDEIIKIILNDELIIEDKNENY